MAIERTDPVGLGPVSSPCDARARDETESSSAPTWILPLARAGELGDRAEFDRLFDEWFHLVYGLAWRRTQDVEQAERWTTSAFVSALQRFLSERERVRPAGRK